MELRTTKAEGLCPTASWKKVAGGHSFLPDISRRSQPTIYHWMSRWDPWNIPFSFTWKKKSMSIAKHHRLGSPQGGSWNRDEHLVESAFRINTCVGKEAEAGWAKREAPNPAGNSKTGIGLQSCPSCVGSREPGLYTYASTYHCVWAAPGKEHVALSRRCQSQRWWTPEFWQSKLPSSWDVTACHDKQGEQNSSAQDPWQKHHHFSTVPLQPPPLSPQQSFLNSCNIPWMGSWLQVLPCSSTLATSQTESISQNIRSHLWLARKPLVNFHLRHSEI